VLEHAETRKTCQPTAPAKKTGTSPDPELQPDWTDVGENGVVAKSGRLGNSIFFVPSLLGGSFD
jgi:hypothetical protein